MLLAVTFESNEEFMSELSFEKSNKMETTVFEASPDGNMQTGRPPKFPLGDLLGIKYVSGGEGKAVFEMQATAQLANPMGTLHGGVFCDIADVAMGAAVVSTLKSGESFTTLELKINFLKPIWESKLQARSHVVKRGQTVALVECDVYDEKENLVARASSTCMILRDEKAKGR